MIRLPINRTIFMNIFISDLSPIVSAQNLDNKRVVKMVLETAQLLSTAIESYTQYPPTLLYKPTHINHPITKWCQENHDNFLWVYNHFLALCDEYTYRFQKPHKTIVQIKPLLENIIINNGNSPTNYQNSARHKEKGIDFSHEPDITIAYQKYLNARWKTDKLIPKWTRRNPPSWKYEI